MSSLRRVKIMHVVGARPNFMKVAPVMAAVQAWNASASGDDIHFEQVLVHTGQHYDSVMSQVFLDELNMPRPQEHLGVGSGSQAAQLARLLERLEPVVERHAPDLVVVPGDVNSTCAAALVASRLGIPVAHLESGLRSGDRSMPEEVNRIIVDHVADLLLTTCADADHNLVREGLPRERIVRVGNTMIDSLLHLLPEAERRASRTISGLGLAQDAFVLVTMHRPSNVDDPEQLRRILGVLRKLSSQIGVVFPMHLRTQKRVDELMNGQGVADNALVVCPPLGYLEFVGLMARASAVLTDSGGVQEETTALGVPCVTMRTSTERPVTIDSGTNRLVDPSDAEAVLAAVGDAIGEGRLTVPPVIELWDGQSGGRVVRALAAWARRG
jgi:UDP-N-acetylglucosamine 2-epimerase (non-hydrolysing)